MGDTVQPIAGSSGSEAEEGEGTRAWRVMVAKQKAVTENLGSGQCDPSVCWHGLERVRLVSPWKVTEVISGEGQ